MRTKARIRKAITLNADDVLGTNTKNLSSYATAYGDDDEEDNDADNLEEEEDNLAAAATEEDNGVHALMTTIIWWRRKVNLSMMLRMMGMILKRGRISMLLLIFMMKMTRKI